MKDRFDAVNEVYYPYVKKHLGNNPLQNILTCGGSQGAINVELDRHKFLTYDNLFHFEVEEVNKDIPVSFHDQIINEDIFWPTNPIESVNLIYADPSPTKNPTTDGIEKILEAGFVNNNLGILVFLFFDGIGVEPFLNKEYGEYNSRDFFSKNVTWYDKYNKGTYSQRLDGVVFKND